jgi:uncharacterized membrane protein
MIDPGVVGARRAERLIGRLLIGITYLAVLLLLVGVALLIGSGVSPLAGGPRLDAGRLVADLIAWQPTGFLWLGLLAVIAAPITRVTIAMLAYGRDGDWLMVGVSAGILIVIALAVVSAVVATV